MIWVSENLGSLRYVDATQKLIVITLICINSLTNFLDYLYSTALLDDVSDSDWESKCSSWIYSTVYTCFLL